MSSSVFAQPLRLSIKPSTCLHRFYLLAHLLAALGVLTLFVRLPLFWAWLPVLGLVLLLVHYRSRNSSLNAYKALVWMPDGQIQLQRHGEPFSVSRLGNDYVTTWLVVLRLRTEDEVIFLPICRDAIVGDQHRRLRVLLRHSPPLTQ